MRLKSTIHFFVVINNISEQLQCFSTSSYSGLSPLPYVHRISTIHPNNLLTLVLLHLARSPVYHLFFLLRAHPYNFFLILFLWLVILLFMRFLHMLGRVAGPILNVNYILIIFIPFYGWLCLLVSFFSWVIQDI